VKKPREPASRAAPQGWNILVYIGADNALSSLVPTLRATLRKVRAKPGVTLCVQETVASKRSSSKTAAAKKRSGRAQPPVTKRYVLKNGVAVAARTLGSVDTGTVAALTNFLDWGVSQAPASKVALVMISHGTGVGPNGVVAKASRPGKEPRVQTSGINYSDYFKSSLSIPSLRLGIEASTNQKVDVLVFDACDMGELELLYELQNVTTYVVASEETIPIVTTPPPRVAIPGFPYDTWLSALAARTDAKSFSTTAVDAFIKHQKKSGNSTSVAALDPRAVTTLATAVGALGTLLQIHLATPGNQDAIEAERQASLGFTIDYFRDLLQVAKNLQTLEKKIPGIAAACSPVVTALRPVVLKAEAVSPAKDAANGLAIVFQEAGSAPLISTYAPLLFAKGAGKGWYKFLRSFVSKSPSKKRGAASA